MSNTDGAVSYSVKELIARLDGKIDGLFVAIGSKADKEETRELDRRIKTLELDSARDTGSRDWIWRFLMAAPGVGSLVYLFFH